MQAEEERNRRLNSFLPTLPTLQGLKDEMELSFWKIAADARNCPGASCTKIVIISMFLSLNI